MPINFKSANLLNYDNWNTSGLPSGFNAISGGGESVIVNATDPFGGTSVVWETRPDGGGGADGGWNTDAYSIDYTKLYRYSVWVRRTSATGGGTFYLGIGGNVIAFSDGHTEGNPYWDCRSTAALTQNVWYLVVGHCFPYDWIYNTAHPDTGLWLTSGLKDTNINGCNIGVDCKATAVGTYYHRTYHYYCLDNTTRLQFFRPRVDLCDGSEIKVSELLANTEKVLGSTSISPEGASVKHKRVVATGGDVITTVGEWRIHRFNGAGTFTISSITGGDTTIAVDYLLVGGGGGGGANMGGGGGGGGVLTGTSFLYVTAYSIGVGGGGSGAPAGTGGHPTTPGSNGGNSTFNGFTAYGGGYGGLSPNTVTSYPGGFAGGCGGGSTGYNNDAVAPGYYGSGAGTPGQGYRGGYQGNQYYSGGGGGAGGAGADGNNPAVGGIGALSGILGKPFYWGGGGGGAGYSIAGANGGLGGGGGGAGGWPSGNGGRSGVTWGVVGQGTCTSCQDNKPGGNGGAYTGGGGGGGSHYNYTNAGGNGGGGCVIIRYKYK